MQLRTDLAIEAAAQLGDKDLPGVKQQTKQVGDIRLTSMVIEDEQGEKALGKPRGRYITAELPPLSDDEKSMEEKSVALGDELRTLLPQNGVILVVGLGNQSVTPDALGPRAAGLVLATRHIQGEFSRSAGLENLRPTAVFIPGVLGQTGVESSEMVKGICEIVKPVAVIVIDALAARSVSRLGCTVQICDTGISPGSGVGNNRMALNRDTLGVTVIGLGVPTVVDARTVAVELTGRREAGDEVTPRGSEMMVTPREIDLIIRRASQLVAMAVNAALQPDYSPLSLISAAG